MYRYSIFRPKSISTEKAVFKTIETGHTNSDFFSSDDPDQQVINKKTHE